MLPAVCPGSTVCFWCLRHAPGALDLGHTSDACGPQVELVRSRYDPTTLVIRHSRGSLACPLFLVVVRSLYGLLAVTGGGHDP